MTILLKFEKCFHCERGFKIFTSNLYIRFQKNSNSFSSYEKLKKKNNAKFTSVIISVISAENDMKVEEKIDKNYGIAIRIDNNWWRHNNFTQWK